MGVFERLALSWKDASFTVFVVLAWLSAWLTSCPQVGIKSEFKAGGAISATFPAPEPRVVAIDDDRESQEYDLEPCRLPGVWLASPPSLTLSQIMPAPSFSLSVLTPAQHLLRC
jgi:hypothetical protein